MVSVSQLPTVFTPRSLFWEMNLKQTSTYRLLPEAAKIKVVVRKMHPPMTGDVRYSQVCFEG
ncbi:MAG: hypothetical protein K0R82_2718 [Flavipsychrobacter sp.]|nr:hypothetical protein [Flavipsychrobacter sp.]